MQRLKQRLFNIKSDDLMFYFIVLTFFLLPVGTAPPLISMGMAFLVWLISGKVFTIRSILVQSWFLPIIPFLVLPWLGLLYSQNIDLGMDYAFKTKYWIAVFVTAGLSLDGKRLYLLLKWFWAGLSMGAFLAFIQFVGLMAPLNRLYLGFGTAHTILVMYLLTGILMASFYFKRAESWKSRFVFLFLILALLFHMAVLRGRAGYLFLIILSPMIAGNLMYRFSFKIKMMVSILLICSLMLSPTVRKVATYTYNNLKMEKETILKGGDAVEFPRVFIFRESIRIMMEHPFIGIGPGGMRESTKAKGRQVATHGHNNFLYMGTSFGIFGIAACFWLFWKMFALSWQRRDTALGYFIFSTCLVLFLGGMLDTQILNTGTLLFLSLTYGFLNHLKVPGEAGVLNR